MYFPFYLYNIPLHVKAWYFWLIAVCVLFSLLLLHIFLLPMLLCEQQIDVIANPSPFSNRGFLWLASIHQSTVMVWLVDPHSIVGRHRLIATIFVLCWLIINYLLFLFILHFFSSSSSSPPLFLSVCVTSNIVAVMPSWMCFLLVY